MCVCLSACPRSHIRNYTSEKNTVCYSVTTYTWLDRSSSDSDRLSISFFMDDVIFAHICHCHTKAHRYRCSEWRHYDAARRLTIEFAARPMVASCIAAAPSEAMSTSSRRTCKGCRPSGAKPAMHQFLVSCCACCLRASYNARVSVCLFVCVGLSQLTGWCSVERFR